MQSTKKVSGTLSAELRRYVSTFELEHLSDADLSHLVDAFVNWVGCALGGANSPITEALRRMYSQMAPGGHFRVLGSQDKFGIVEAVTIDCVASAVLAYDDTHLETVLHPTGPVASALLGQARLQPVSGREFLAALHVGMELECRAGLAITSAGTGAKRGWYLTGITGGIGAAAAVARIMRLGEAEILATLGMAATRAAGNRGTHGSMAATYVPGMAAETGIIAAHLAGAGLLCGVRAFDGPSGLLDLITDHPAFGRALEGLGTVSEAARTAFKPYPCGIVAHPVVDACLTLVNDHGVNGKNLALLDLLISQTAHDLVANKYPETVIEIPVSLYYWGAVALHCGAAGVDQLSPSLVKDPTIRQIQDKMSTAVDSSLADDQCVAHACLVDGRRITVKIDHATGSIARPMTSKQIDSKFFELASAAMPIERAVQMHHMCRNILTVQRVDHILEI